jgi:uncharacterized membrane protein YhaH (DUF805 family)
MSFLRAFFSFYGRLGRGEYATVFLCGYVVPLCVFLALQTRRSLKTLA